VIPNLEDISFGKRVVLAAAVIILVLLLLMLLDQPSRSSPTVLVATTEYDEHLLELDKQALEDAYRTQLAHVFSVWMRDYHLGVSSRAATGFSNARKAYVDAKRELEKREQAIKR
jgi:hypothetical protein